MGAIKKRESICKKACSRQSMKQTSNFMSPSHSDTINSSKHIAILCAIKRQVSKLANC